MNGNKAKSIEAVVEIEASYQHDKILPPWVISKSDDYLSFIRLYAGISDEELGAVMYIACSYNSRSENELIKESAVETLQTFISEEDFVMPGGLAFKKNDELIITPGCCCGLEEWNTWFEVPNGETSIWNGHDLITEIEIENEQIRVYEYAENEIEKSSIEFSVSEMTELLLNAEKDLKDFLVRLAQWTNKIEPSLEKQVVNHFAKNMNIDL